MQLIYHNRARKTFNFDEWLSGHIRKKFYTYYLWMLFSPQLHDLHRYGSYSYSRACLCNRATVAISPWICVDTRVSRPSQV